MTQVNIIDAYKSLSIIRKSIIITDQNCHSARNVMEIITKKCSMPITQVKNTPDSIISPGAYR